MSNPYEVHGVDPDCAHHWVTHLADSPLWECDECEGQMRIEAWRGLREAGCDAVNRAEGDGRAEREPTVPASQLRAFARLCVDGGDMTPAAARMLDRIIAGDGRAEK